MPNDPDMPDNFLRRLERIEQAAFQMLDESLPDIQVSKGTPEKFDAEFEPKTLEANFLRLAVRMAKRGWTTDGDADNAAALSQKLTADGKLRLQHTCEIYLNAMPQFYYSKSAFRPVPENIVIPKRDQTLILVDLMSYIRELEIPPVPQGESIVLRAFIAWYVEKFAARP